MPSNTTPIIDAAGAAPRPQLVDVNAAAAVLHVCSRTVAHLVQRGELPVVTIGRRKLFDVADLSAFIAANKSGGTLK